jgi:hypothetical protein
MRASQFPCPYLGGIVELGEEREHHIAERHPDLLPAYRNLLATTLADPDQVRLNSRVKSAKILSRWYSEIAGGKHLVIVVVTEPKHPARRWIVTAYLARRLAEAIIEWTRS